jgi:MoaD family protein
MKTIHVRYYAVLREQRGRSEEPVKSAAADVGDLYDELRRKHGFGLTREHVKAAVNGEIGGWDAGLKPGDSVAFFPPMAGG